MLSPLLQKSAYSNNSIFVFVLASSIYLQFSIKLQGAPAHCDLPSIIFIILGVRRRSFSMTIRASNLSLILASPSLAVRWRFPPSKMNGMVTIPIQSMPISLIISAMTDIAPVPAPPPVLLSRILCQFLEMHP